MTQQMTRRTFVLVPGAGGSAGNWYRVEAELRRRGHDVVAVDLPAADDAAGLPEYRDAVIAAIGDRSDVVLVAQSMAGFTAPQVCEAASVSLLVLVNAMIPSPGETPGEWWDATGQPEAMSEKDALERRTGFDPATHFLHDVPRYVLEDPRTVPPGPQSDTPFGQRWPLAAWPGVPTRAIAGRDDRFFPADFQRRVAEERLGVTPSELPGGHLIALSHPEELADELEAYAASPLGSGLRIGT
jgi:pimeloyl-ACP methyl ester carboxylesterase